METTTAAANTAIESIQEVFTGITSSVSVGDIASIIGIALAVCVGLVLFYFGARKVSRMVVTAFKSGKLRF